MRQIYYGIEKTVRDNLKASAFWDTCLEKMALKTIVTGEYVRRRILYTAFCTQAYLCFPFFFFILRKCLSELELCVGGGGGGGPSSEQK